MDNPQRMPQTSITALLLFNTIYTTQGTTHAWAEKTSSYAPVVIKEEFQTTRQRMVSEKPTVIKRHKKVIARTRRPLQPSGHRRHHARSQTGSGRGTDQAIQRATLGSVDRPKQQRGYAYWSPLWWNFLTWCSS